MYFQTRFCLHLPNDSFYSKYKASSSFTVSKVKGKPASLFSYDRDAQLVLGLPGASLLLVIDLMFAVSAGVAFLSTVKMVKRFLRRLIL